MERLHYSSQRTQTNRTIRHRKEVLRKKEKNMNLTLKNVRSVGNIYKHFSVDEVMGMIAEHGLQYKEIVRKAIGANRQMRVTEEKETPYMELMRKKRIRTVQDTPRYQCARYAMKNTMDDQVQWLEDLFRANGICTEEFVEDIITMTLSSTQ